MSFSLEIVSAPSSQRNFLGGCTVGSSRRYESVQASDCLPWTNLDVGRSRRRNTRHDGANSLWTHSWRVVDGSPKWIPPRRVERRQPCLLARPPHQRSRKLDRRSAIVQTTWMPRVIATPRRQKSNPKKRMCAMRPRETNAPIGCDLHRRFAFPTRVCVRCHRLRYEQFIKVPHQQITRAPMGSRTQRNGCLRDRAGPTFSCRFSSKPQFGPTKIGVAATTRQRERRPLYGVLPLCVGMPVRATDHLDRERGVLKGCKGVVHGWSACSGSGVWQKPPEVTQNLGSTLIKEIHLKVRKSTLIREEVFKLNFLN